jgi:hypothetical protein
MTLNDKLRRPFPVSQLKWRQAGGGKEVVYIDARQYQSRLDEVFGFDWQCKHTIVHDKGVVCEVSVKIDGEWITRSDGAGETNVEGEKGQFTDAFKRACVKFGVAKYLYEFKGVTADNIPKWATPEGYDEIMKNRETEQTTTAP